MKVFVTGGSGYIGSVCVEMLINEGHEVVVFDNLERGHCEALHPDAKFVKGDLLCKEDIFNALEENPVDVVMHFAAYALVGESMAQPELYFRNNVVGGANLAEAMVRAGIKKIVFSSTCATYGQPDTDEITEDTIQCPTNPYGESKLMFEKMLLWYEKLHDIKPVFLRYFNACGASDRYGEDHEPESHIIPNVLAVALGKKSAVSVFGYDYPTPDGTCVRDYIHILDLAQAHLLAATKDVTGPFNLGTGTGISVKQIVDACIRVTGKDIPYEMCGRRPGDPAKLIANANKAKTILGWVPKYSDVDSIVESAWKWHQQNPDGYE
ncbi:MAG: UDP-glucose 4-epimerase GalE [Kiritimatiellae bacterium]|jgi:UDP-glucose 4-epimerase|nr:UDP-glucose 4-epimerase GalE [Kiritimatiellia bacterium]